MTTNKLEDVIRNVPQHVTLFRVIKVYPWMEIHGVVKGDLFYYHHLHDYYVPIKSQCKSNMNLKASVVDFVKYVERSNLNAPSFIS